MMDEKPKRRPWFQLHLSTCVVLMVVAGAYVGANTLKRETLTPIVTSQARVGRETRTNGTEVALLEVTIRRKRLLRAGFPEVIYEGGESATFEYSRAADMPGMGGGFPPSPEGIAAEVGNKFPEESAIPHVPVWYWTSIVKNLWLLMYLLIMVGFFCEVLIRRRKRKHAAMEPAP